MKIVHLNTHSYGGAAVVARRIHRAALASGLDSRFITQYGLASDPTPNYTRLKDARVRYYLRKKSAHRRLHALGKLAQRALQHENLANRPAGLEVFSPLNERRLFADCAAPYDPDIIHLHWIAGFVDHADFFRSNGARKFVWTLHDMNPITGGCHHADGCLGFAGDCRACPQLAGTIDPDYAARVLADKTNSLAQLSDDQLVIVSPSRWLLELSRQSRVTARFAHVLIENPSVDAATAPAPVDARRQLGLPATKKIVLFVSDNLRNPRKGVDLLFAAVRLMARKDELQLVGIGQSTDAPRDLSVIMRGTVADEATMLQYLSSADVLVSPSSAENSPLVVIEALSCGTPVVAFEVGGVPELVNADRGRLAKERTPENLAAALEDVLFGHARSRSEIRASAAAHAPAAVFEKYHEVYSELAAS
jgi:glycosyltransferase involved in cell wall biosynthesis